MELTNTTLDGVKEVTVTILGIEDRAATIHADTALFGELPELDSLAVLEVVTNLEARVGITIKDEEFTGEASRPSGASRESWRPRSPVAIDENDAAGPLRRRHRHLIRRAVRTSFVRAAGAGRGRPVRTTRLGSRRCSGDLGQRLA